MIATQALHMADLQFGRRGVKSYLMDCNEEAVNFAQTCICESTKAFVRCFAPVSIIVALVVASQLVLSQRVFYAMIRSGVLIDFKNLSPIKDPLFWWVLLNGVLAISHFVFHMLVAEQMHIGKDNLENVIASLKQDMLFFGLPAILYVVFLYLSYDVEWLLLPLNKFWEEDPEWAHKTSSEMAFVQEWVASLAVLHDPVSLQDVADSIALQSKERRDEDRLHHSTSFLQRHFSSSRLTAWVPAQRLQKLKERLQSREIAPAGPPPRKYFVERAWIARLMTNAQLVAQDRKCKSFYIAWLVWMILTSLICLAAVGLLIMQLKNDIEDIISGQREEYVCIAVIGANVIIMIIVSYYYVVDLLFP